MAGSDSSTQKTCTRCARTLPATSEHFNKNKKGLFGLSAECKPCFNKRGAAYRAANRDAELERYAAYRAKNAGAIAERSRIAYYANQERERERALAWYRDNAERANERKRRQYQEDPVAGRARKKAWMAENPEWQGVYYRRRRATDARYRVSSNMSRRVRESLAAGKSGRSWTQLVDYTIDELRAHLERQFVGGMSWGNYGEWHIDHIMPVASFHFSDTSDPEFKACWALSNLRPLWGPDNVKKGAKASLLL